MNARERGVRASLRVGRLVSHRAGVFPVEKLIGDGAINARVRISRALKTLVTRDRIHCNNALAQAAFPVAGESLRCRFRQLAGIV